MLLQQRRLLTSTWCYCPSSALTLSLYRPRGVHYCSGVCVPRVVRPRCRLALCSVTFTRFTAGTGSLPVGLLRLSCLHVLVVFGSVALRRGGYMYLVSSLSSTSWSCSVGLGLPDAGVRRGTRGFLGAAVGRWCLLNVFFVRVPLVSTSSFLSWRSSGTLADLSHAVVWRALGCSSTTSSFSCSVSGFLERRRALWMQVSS